MHGCKRLQSHADLWGHALSANGYAVLAIDSFSPRNFGPFVQKYGVCTGLTLWGRERSADLMTALYMIQRGVGVDTSSLDTQRIGVIGFSHGAWTTMDLLTQWTNGTLPSRLSSNLLPANGPSAADIDALVLVYPWCGIASLTSSVKAWAHIPPSQFLRPYKDSVVGDNGCNGNIASLTAAAPALTKDLYQTYALTPQGMRLTSRKGPLSISIPLRRTLPSTVSCRSFASPFSVDRPNR